MKVEELKLSENALLAADLLRKLVEEIEKPDIIFDGSVEELVMLLDIAAHTSSHDIVQCAQQFLGFSGPNQILFFKSVGVRLDFIFSAKMLASVQREIEEDAFDGELDSFDGRYKYM